MSARKQPPDDRQFKVGDRILVSLSSGRVEEATVKAVIEQNNETRLTVDYGHDETFRCGRCGGSRKWVTLNDCSGAIP